MVGEAGPELVNVTPMSQVASAGANGMSSTQPVNINITENIDLRGAYGITNPSVARKVWDTVWAPARRQSVNRVLDMRGKIQRWANYH